MQKIKYFLWLVIVAVLAIFIYQNNEYFMAEHSIGINLYFFEGESGELPNILYFLAVFVIGFLVSLLLSFSYGYKKRKTIKELNEKINADKQRIDEMESRLAAVEGSGSGTAGSDVGADSENAVDAEISRA
ncbi:MAG: lipopolysaccharide assembly protein LapA domain-containing protein [Thermodesulfobacteriota bacterium]